MSWFISHSFKDKIWAKDMVDILKKLNEGTSVSDDRVFFSSNADYGSDYTKGLLDNINENIQSSDCLVLLVTENYLRSQFCYYEMCIAGYLRGSKSIILIVQNEDVYNRIRSLFSGSLYINAADEANVDIFINTVNKNAQVNKATREMIKNFFENMMMSEYPVAVPFLGMTEARYNNAYAFAEKYNVEKMTFGYPANEKDVAKHLAGAREVIFVSTTGSGFLKTYKRLLSDAVANGADLSIVIADKNSDFCHDVSEIEVFNGDDIEKLVQSNSHRIETEFDSSIQYLNEIYNDSKLSCKQTQGEITCYCGYTLIRQTAFIVRYEDDSVWGWITCTMPPERSADKTPSFVVKGNIGSDVFARVVWQYCKTITQLSEKRGAKLLVRGNAVPEKFVKASHGSFEEFLLEAKQYWQNRQKTAKSNMKYSSETNEYDAVLIEVAAQHPLKQRTKPNAEFAKRLDKAVELYKEYSGKGLDVSVYVPGSRHKFNGIADDISLSEAGCNYLIEKGIPQSVIIGNEANIRYKGEDGVYNSADECFVASRIFFDGEYGKLVCVCSPHQIMRKTMLYLEFGCVPVCYGVTADKMYHGDIVREIFDSLNSVLYFDHSWQNRESDLYSYFREERKA